MHIKLTPRWSSRTNYMNWPCMNPPLRFYSCWRCRFPYMLRSQVFLSEFLSVISVPVRVHPLAFTFAFRWGGVLVGPAGANSRGIGCELPMPPSWIGANPCQISLQIRVPAEPYALHLPYWPTQSVVALNFAEPLIEGLSDYSDTDHAVLTAEEMMLHSHGWWIGIDSEAGKVANRWHQGRALILYIN